MKDPTFISRKIDHLRHALRSESEAKERSELEGVRLIHDSLPDLNLADIQIGSPFFIAGMTAGHADAEMINDRLAKASSIKGWVFGLGSQRREIDTMTPDHFAQTLKKRYPSLKLISNLGISQLVELDEAGSFGKLSDLLEATQAQMIAIHLNPLQEAIQTEGTPKFKGSLRALENLKSKIKIPFILKETGSGMSSVFLKRIHPLEPFAVDVSGLGGTHWGRVEGFRAEPKSLSARLGETFKDWGVGTISSVINAAQVFNGTKTEVWASGGIRSGLDAAKCIALGAKRVGFAKPALEAALTSEAEVVSWMSACEAELKIALFCTGSATIDDLNKSKVESAGCRRE